MKKTLITTTLTAAVLLVGCSAPANDADPNFESLPAADTPVPEPVEETIPEVEVNDRGSVVMQPGETEILYDLEDDSDLLSFTVNSVEVNPECTGERSDDPENGTFVVFEAEVDSDITAADHYLDPGLIFNSAGYRVIDEDGTTRGESPNTSAAHNCFPESDSFPINLGPGEKASGKVVFDVPVDSGSLLMDIDPSQGLQYEWEF